jgi:hypothetical protein
MKTYFEPLSEKGHMLLLMIHNGQRFHKDNFQEEIAELKEKGYIFKSGTVNTRGTAFIHKARQGRVSIQDILTYSTLRYKQELMRELKRNLEVEELLGQKTFDSMVKKNIDNFKKEDK